MTAPAPSVAVLVAAYEAAPYVGHAVRSALAQDYVGDVHVIVTDDGSTDGTGDVVAAIAAEHPERVTLVRQENRGSVGAVNRCAEQQAALDADYLAILDADDAWPADKLTAQIALLESRPEVGLVYGDMRVIDGAGNVVQESWLADARPPAGRSFSTFLRENLVTGSSIVVRGTLRDALFPIPPDDMAWADWWLAVRVSQFSEIAYLPLPRTLYRFHGTNMSLGAQGTARLRELRRGLRLQRWFLRRVEAADVDVEELERAWDAFARVASEALTVAGTPFVELVSVSDLDRAEAASLAARARELAGNDQLHEALAVAVRGAAADPLSDDARGALLDVRAALGPGAVGPQPLRGARPLVACVAADDLLRDPALLRGCADAFGDLEDVTIAVDAVEFDASEAAARISALAEEHGFADDPRLDLALVVGPLDELGAARLRAGLTVRIGTRRPSDGTAWFAPDDLAGARAALLAARAR